MRLTRLLPFATLAVLAACSSSPSSPPDGATPKEITALPRALSAGELAVIAAANRFAPALLAQVNATRAQQNVFISPLSASMALGMTLNGAGGDTYSEMRSALGFGTTSREAIIQSYRDLIALLRALDPKVDFRIANAIWYQQRFAPSIAPTFLSEATQYFGATSRGLDFADPASLRAVNDWVSTSTSGKITSIVDELPPNLVMLLVNAIYFKGDWREAFDKSKTTSAPFTTEGSGVVRVPMMQRTGAARVGVADGRTIVDLGYGGDAFSMSILLPRAGESVNSLVASLTEASWGAAVASLRTGEVELTMPRFSMTWEAELNAPLKALGMRQAFVEGGADFTRLSPTLGRDLFISFVKQKTFVDVNEVGTEAAAVTGVGVGVTSIPQRTVVRVDRPFVFAIRERLSGTILFIGKIMQPPAA